MTTEYVQLGSAYLANRDGDVVTLEFEAEITYSAELSFDDPEKTAYDSETGHAFVFESVSKTVKETAWLEAEVEIMVNSEDPSRSQLKSTFLVSDDIGVPAPADPDYK